VVVGLQRQASLLLVAVEDPKGWKGAETLPRAAVRFTAVPMT